MSLKSAEATTSPGIRKFAFAVHLTVSTGWIGAVGVCIGRDVAAADLSRRRRMPVVAGACAITLDYMLSQETLECALPGKSSSYPCDAFLSFAVHGNFGFNGPARAMPMPLTAAVRWAP